MQLAVDLPDETVAALDRIAAAQQCSRDVVIQDALAAYTAEHSRRVRDKAFGLWGDREIDGVGYQRKLREEW